MSKKKPCPICKNILSSYLDFGKFPLANFPIDVNKFSKYIKKKNINPNKNLSLLICKKCKYLSLRSKAKEEVLNDVYSKFYKYPSALLKQLNPVRDDAFLKTIFNNIKFKKYNSILEIGCYDGYILSKIKNKFKHLEIYGCEPSEGADIATKHGLNVKKKFFDKKTFPGKKFDIIVIRHTLEHIYNLDKILKNIKSAMNDNSILLIEVPNINYYLKHGLLEVFSFQHIHYFSFETFFNLAKRNNFLFFKKKETPENLIVYFKKNYQDKKLKQSKFNNYSINFKKKIKENQKKIKNILLDYNSKDICFWGAGGFAVAAINLYKVDMKKNSLIVDKDKKKHGLSINNTIIEKISKNKLIKKKLVIITSYYSDQILKEIKDLKINVDVLQIFPKIILKKNV